MENVKKCKNFLSTLIKLATSAKQSSQTAANVKDLVKNLLVSVCICVYGCLWKLAYGGSLFFWVSECQSKVLKISSADGQIFPVSCNVFTTRLKRIG